MPAAKRRDARAQQPSRSSSHSRGRLISLFVVGPLLSVLALTSLAYLGLSQQAQRDTTAQVGVAAQAAHGVLQANTGALQITNGQLASALPANVTKLNNNNAEAQSLRAQVGMDTVVAQREQTAFVIVASSLAPNQPGASAAGLGERLSGGMVANICSTPTRSTTGTLTIGGVSYLAGAVPLTDGTGACVGAVVTLSPSSALRQAPLEYTIILAMAGALLALITVVAGLMLSGRNAAGALEQNERARAAVLALTDTQTATMAQLEQREWINRRLTTGRQRMRHVMATLATDRVALQESASDIWAGVSHPGAPVDPTTAMRLAREGAVVASRIGSRLNDIDSMTESLFADLETAHEINGMLDSALARSDEAIADLCALTGVAAPDGGAAMRPSAQSATPPDPFATNLLEAQRQRARQTPGVAPSNGMRQTGGYRAMRPESAQHRAIRPDVNRPPAYGDRGATGKTPAPGQSQYGRRPSDIGASAQSGQYRQPGLLSSSGRHPGRPPQSPRPSPPPQPRNGFDAPQDARNRDESGSRWLND